jgi:catechol-2,3-dioxygenase
MKIRALDIETHCLADLYHFYINRLELPAGRPSQQRGIDSQSFTIALEGTLLTFSKASQGKPFYHFAFNIAENKIDEALQWVQHKGIVPIEWHGIVVHDFKNWNAHSFYFFDPAGNIVEFIARHDLKETARTEPFHAAHILSVSEIGWVLDDVSAAVQDMQDKLQLPLYYTESGSQNFAAMGDPHGLFILVKKGRAWFPTRRPACIFPMQVLVHHASAQKVFTARHFPSMGYPYSLKIEAD